MTLDALHMKISSGMVTTLPPPRSSMVKKLPFASMKTRIDPAPIPGDLNADGHVNLTDLATLLTHFGTTSGEHRADGDVDGDGDVDLSDLATLLTNFGL